MRKLLLYFFQTWMKIRGLANPLEDVHNAQFWPDIIKDIHYIFGKGFFGGGGGKARHRCWCE